MAQVWVVTQAEDRLLAWDIFDNVSLGLKQWRIVWLRRTPFVLYARLLLVFKIISKKFPIF